MSIRMTDEEFRRLFQEEEQQERQDEEKRLNAELKRAKIETEKARAERLKQQPQTNKNNSDRLTKTDIYYFLTVAAALAAILANIIFALILLK